MVEFNPSLPTPELPGGSNDNSERKSKKRSKRKAKGAADLGGLVANESLIWQRDASLSEVKPKNTAQSIAEALARYDKKDTIGSTPKTSEVTDVDGGDTTSKAESKTDEHRDSTALGAETENDSTESTGTAEDGEHDAELARLTPEEMHHALDEYVQVRGMEVAAEQVVAVPNGPEAAALAADAAMIERLRDKLAADPTVLPDVATEAAYQETLAELPLVEPSEVGSRSPAGAAESIPVIPIEVEPTEPESTDASAGVVGTPPPPVPPRPPERAGSPDAMPPEPGVPLPILAAPRGETSPVPYSPDMISVAEAAHFARRAETRGLLVGGLVGYFIGRRRGRIKAEKRLLPVQAKLEKQVRSLHDTIAAKESQIRQEAARRAVQAKELAETRQQPQQPIQPERLKQLPPPPEVPPPFRPEAIPAVAPEYQQPAFEMPQSGLGQQLTQEVAAATAVLAGRNLEVAPQAQAAERLSVYPESRELAAERIQHISTQELIMSSETVVIGNERLRDIYESKRISEPGLRRVMVEHARGGNVEKILAQEIQNKELTYERDPRMRKRLAESLSAAGERAVKAKDATKPLLTKQAIRAKQVGKQLVDQAVSTAGRLDSSSNPTQQVLVRAWVTVTVVLAVIALILLFR